MENTGTEVEVGATRDGEGSGGGGGGGEAGAGNGAETGTDAAAAPCVPSAEDLCRGNYETATIPDPTMEDLASFRPAAPWASSEPAGIGIAGMPTNLVVAASTHTVTGELFGYAVTVRFTPTAFTFRHGDGTSARRTTPGATWASLGQAQFTPTPTSHTYSARGEYTVTVATEYTAQVNFGGGWRQVPGTLTLTAGGYPLRIVEARTALVDRTCLEAPSAPGC
ncbi:MAG: hypothetical protein NT132_08270 [Microbacterium sp.]|uniref:hypothetical protein n=1 Tax=Microbacterium sp. TaxID=51671 RepID=UPI0026285361|nr:hypothetical protein [Microbacterium sp.]MCX6502381.1 hypothetical protein [Microbacterium sp.]